MSECDLRKNLRLPIVGALNIKSYSMFLKQSRISFNETWNQQFVQQEESLSDFKLLKLLGSGTFGTVILVKQKATDRYYAMKAVEKEKIIKNKVIGNIKFEKKVLECLDCPMSVYIDFFFMDKCYIYMLMPYITGGELFTILKKNVKFDEEQTKFLVGQIVIALEYLHVLDLVHRDVKPENIIMDHTGYLKLVDFGFCKRLTTSQRTYTLCGTPEYLAPEVILNKGYGKPVDWWAIGVLTYELATGKSPFNGKNTMNIYEKVISVKYVMPDYFSNDIKDLIKRILQVDLTKRFGNLKDGVEDIKRHSWFSSINWLALLNRRIPPSFVPININEPSNSQNNEPIALKNDCEDKYAEEFNDF